MPVRMSSSSRLSVCHFSSTLLTPFLFLLSSSCLVSLSPFLFPNHSSYPNSTSSISFMLPLSAYSISFMPFLFPLPRYRSSNSPPPPVPVPAPRNTPNPITYLESSLSSKRLSFFVDASSSSSSSFLPHFRSIMILTDDNSSSLTPIHNWRLLLLVAPACLPATTTTRGNDGSRAPAGEERSD